VMILGACTSEPERQHEKLAQRPERQHEQPAMRLGVVGPYRGKCEAGLVFRPPMCVPAESAIRDFIHKAIWVDWRKLEGVP
jgi:hypothetical protein